MRYLSSRAIHAVDYDDATATLRVQFQPHGRVYDYHGVPRVHFEGLCEATSPGRYFNQYIAPLYGLR